MTKLAEKYTFLDQWKKHQRSILMNIYPELDKKELDILLDDIIKETMINPKAEIHNNYIHKSINDDLLSVVNWMERTNPIASGFGVFFKNQKQALNPAAVMLEKFMTLRKDYKGQLKNHHEDSYEYKTFDRFQLTEKVNSNSYYGASGAETSNFYNLYAATSVTAAGQSLISTTEQAFEAFLSNNVPFIDLDDCMNFLENIRKEKTKLDASFLPYITIDKLFERLTKKFYEYNEEYMPIIMNYLMNQSDEFIKRAYFKNNIYEFSYLPTIRAKLTRITENTTEFKDPNKVPDSIKNYIEDLWDNFRDFVFYNYPSFDRIQRLKNDKRKTVIIVDTDSNFLNLNPWVEFMFKFIVEPNDKLAVRDTQQNRFIAINTMCYVITNMITEVLAKYTKGANIPKDFRSKINMKNEYLLSRIILSSKKKRYVASARLREGREIFPEKTEIKGMDFIKSTTRDETKQYFTKLIENRILKVDKIIIGDVLRDLENFEKIILESLHKGERSFLIPASVKEIASYKDPFKMQGMRAVVAWNYLYPNNTIELPEKVDLIKVKLGTAMDIEKVREVSEEHYNIMVKHILGNRIEKIADKGVQVIALPRNVDGIPEWILPFIDYRTIVTDNLKRFYSVLESLGIQTIKSSKREYISNILKI
jgi:DNA polymerase elongation subunit (family B)